MANKTLNHYGLISNEEKFEIREESIYLLYAGSKLALKTETTKTIRKKSIYCHPNVIQL